MVGLEFVDKFGCLNTLPAVGAILLSGFFERHLRVNLVLLVLVKFIVLSCDEVLLQTMSPRFLGVLRCL